MTLTAEERIHTLEVDVALLEKDVAQVVKDCRLLAGRDWVLIDVVQPIKDSIVGMKTAMDRMVEQSDEVSSAFRESIQNEEKRREIQREENTTFAKIKRWGSIAVSIAAILGLIEVVLMLVRGYLKAHGF